MEAQIIAFPKPKSSFVFIHRRLVHVNFYILAPKWYEAVCELELILGPSSFWIDDYMCISNGQVVGMSKAV